TLGVITAASLKLFAPMRAVAAAFIALPDVRAAVDLLATLREATGELVSSFELIPRIAIELTTRHIPAVIDPLAKPYPWYVLCELGSSRSAEPCTELLEEALGVELERGRVVDAELVERGSRWVREHVPDGRLVAYGHVGDGNLHFNLNQAPGTDAAVFLQRAPAVMRAMHDLVASLGGSFSAEHGIGRLKIAELERYAQPVELELMRAVKHAFDPHGILNPGKVLRTGPRDELHPPGLAARQ